MNKKIPFFSLLLLSQMVFANAGTALMWATMGHLTIGNLVIIISEYIVIRIFFKCKKWLSLFLIILANVFSSGIGITYLSFLSKYIDDASLNEPIIFKIKFIIIFSIMILYFLTILLKFPLFYFSIKESKKNIKKLITVIVSVHIVFYAILFIYYNSVSGLTILSFKQNNIDINNLLYYDKNSHDLIYFKNLKKTIIYHFESDSYGKYYLKKQNNNENIWDLIIENHDKKIVGTRKNIVTNFIYFTENINENKYYLTNLYYPDNITDYRNIKNDFKTNIDFTWGTGIYIKSEKFKNKIAFETIFGTWHTKNAIILNNYQMIFEMKNQIFHYDIKSKEINYLYYGNDPLIVLDNITLSNDFEYLY